MKEFFKYLWLNKKWWLVPPVIIIVLLGVLLYVSASSPISPFIYVLF